MENEIILRTPSLWKKKVGSVHVSCRQVATGKNGGGMQPPVLYKKKICNSFSCINYKNPQANCYLNTLSDHCTFKM